MLGDQAQFGRVKEFFVKVRALISFVGYDGEGIKRRVVQGDEFDLPAGVDWLVKGLVVEVSNEAPIKAEASRKKKSA